ncbi:unnamed protein product [marine sediment metagenome]|uniref:Toxin n=1 Tax=marine sediment metagenome TaxID=412755 RepID=X1VCL0_9ZZZZ
MKYEWDPEKNIWLKRERNISLEQIIFHLSKGDIWKIAEHPDQTNYPGQKIYFVVIEDYVYLVPHIDILKVNDFYSFSTFTFIIVL